MMPATTEMVVLVVDDDEDLRASLTTLFEDAGFAAVSASNGAVAKRLLEDGLRPHVILLDLMMPVMSGYELKEWLQRDERFASTPVVVFTAHATQVDGKPVLQKPVGPDTLLQALMAAMLRPQ